MPPWSRASSGCRRWSAPRTRRRGSRTGAWSRSTAPREPSRSFDRRRVRRPGLLTAAMLGVASGTILVPLNSTMLAVALPDVMSTFTLGANEVSSLVTLYLGAVAVALPVGGSIGDRFGHRRAF